MHTNATIDEWKEMPGKVNVTREYRVPIANRYSTSSVHTLSTSLFNILDVSSSTWTVIRLSAATLLYAALLVGASNSAPNGCLRREMSWRACIRLSAGETGEGDRSDAVSRDRARNGRPRRHVRGCLTTGAVLEEPEDDGESRTEEDWSFVFSSVSVIVPTGCLQSRK